jgi:hypothetical protein
MIIKSATRLALSAACVSAIAALATANAQPANTSGTASGSYWTSPGANGTAPGAYPPPETYTAPGGYPAQGQYVPPPPPDQGMGGTQVVTNGPQTNPGDVSPSWSARRNVAESEHYDRLLERNLAFRAARERKECAPITDPQLHQQCVNSFAQFEPSGSTGYGSSSATGSRSGAGR